MTQQGQGDVVRDIRDLLKELADAAERRDVVAWLRIKAEQTDALAADVKRRNPNYQEAGVAALLRETADELTRLRTLLSSSRGEQGWPDLHPKIGKQVLPLRGVIKVDDLGEGRVVLAVERQTMEQLWAILTDLQSASGSVPTSAAGQGTGIEKLIVDAFNRGISWWRENTDDTGTQPAFNLQHKAAYDYADKALSVAPQPTAGGDADAE